MPAAGEKLPRAYLALALLLGAGCWLPWLAGLVAGGGAFDALTEDPIGLDYAVFYTAGRTVLDGQIAHLYDWDLQCAAQKALFRGRWQKCNTFANPPHFALLLGPLAALPYLPSLLAWSLLGLGALWGALRLLGGSLLLALCFFPLCLALQAGQSSPHSVGIAALSYALWSRGRPALGGLCAAVLLYKPHLVAGLALLFLLELRTRPGALLGFLGGAALQGALTLTVLHDSLPGYGALLRRMLDHGRWPTFPLVGVYSWRALFHLLWPGRPLLEQGGAAAGAALGVVVFLRLVRRHDAPALRFAGAVVLGLWTAPYLMNYDWALLLVPALLLWHGWPALRPRWLRLFAALWLLSLLATLLPMLQLRLLPRALHPAMPALGVCAWLALRWLEEGRYSATQVRTGPVSACTNRERG